MKAQNIIKSILALSLAVASVTSCQEKINGGRGFTKGEAVKFSVGSAGSSLDTKAAYSGATSDGIERIDWQEGDLIRIYCDAVDEPSTKWADYAVTSVDTPTSGSATSKARIAGTGGVGLRWGDESDPHVFYGMFPSPAVAGNGTSLGDGTMVGFIPATQKPVSLNATAASTAPNFTAVADLTSEYMAAKTTVTAGTQTVAGGVFLNFKPIVTAIEFTITNDSTKNTDSDLLIKSISLTSESHNIAGTFTVDMSGLADDGSVYPVCQCAGGKSVTMDFTNIPGYTYVEGKKYIKLEKGKTLRFTMFLAPDYNEGGTQAVSVDDLTFQINKAKADGTDAGYMKTFLGYTDGSGVVFPCHKKSFVTGLLVPEGAQWTVNYGSAGAEDPNAVTVVTKWNKGVEDKLEMKIKQLPGSLPGVFSVSADKQVRFSQGNMYWDGTTYKFEANQYDFRHYKGKSSDTAYINGEKTTTPENTVGSFYWIKNTETSVHPYDGSYGTCKPANTANTDVFFTNKDFDTPNENFTVNDVTGKYRTLSKEEWQYLFSSDGFSNDKRKDKYKYGVNVCGLANCVVIVPDECLGGYNFVKDKTSYNKTEWAEAEKAGLVCLPAAGKRNLYGINSTTMGLYWYSTSSYDINLAYCLSFSQLGITVLVQNNRSDGNSVRLVTDAE